MRAAEEHHHERLEHRGEAVDRGVDFVVVEVGELGEHRVHRAGLLTDGDHLHHHAREHADRLQRFGDGLAFRDRGTDLLEARFDHLVAGGLRADLERVEDRHARREHRREGATEARHRDLAQQRPEERQLQEDRVGLVAEARRAAPRLDVGDGDRHGRREDDEDPALQPVAEVDHHLCRRGKLAAEVLEHLLEDRNHLDQQQRQHADRDHHHGARVDHRALDLALQAVGLLEIGRKAVEDRVEHAADLAGGDQVHVEFVEDARVLRRATRRRWSPARRRSSRARASPRSSCSPAARPGSRGTAPAADRRRSSWRTGG